MEKVLRQDQPGPDAGKDHSDKVNIQIRVNHNPVTVTKKQMTGLEIKDAAIAQKVNIRRDFVLIKVEPNGKRDTIGDNDEVKMHDGLEFEAIADDDNS